MERIATSGLDETRAANDAEIHDPPAWGATIGGVFTLAVATTPFPYWPIVIIVGVAMLALGLYVLSRGMARGGRMAAHGVSGTVTSALGTALALFFFVTAPDTEPGPQAGLPAPVYTDAGDGYTTLATEEPTPAPGPLAPERVSASSTAPDSTDAAGRTVTFAAAGLTDREWTTAWRTAGPAINETLTFGFARPVHLTSLGLVPGYAKSDPSSGVDRFRENRRVTGVVYTFSDGSTQSQDFRDEPSMQSITVQVETTSVTITITGSSDDFKRDFTAISEVEFTGW